MKMSFFLNTFSYWQGWKEIGVGFVFSARGGEGGLMCGGDSV